MKKKYFKLTALVLAGMLAINVWSHSFDSKADGTEDASANINTSAETNDSAHGEGTTQSDTSNQDENTGVREGLSESEMVSIPKGEVKWDENDFIITGSSVEGFSKEGFKKLKRAENGFTLTFPSKVHYISDDAFNYHRLIQKAKEFGLEPLEEGIQGEVVFGPSVTIVGNRAFKGNTKITKVTVEDGDGSFTFQWDAFSASRLKTEVDENGGEHKQFITHFKNYSDTYKEVKPSELQELNLGTREYHIYRRAFLRSGVKELDFSKAKAESQIYEFTFFGSRVEEVKSWGLIKRLDGGSFARTKLKSLNIPKTLEKIRFFVFAGIPTLKSVDFEEDIEEKYKYQIDGSSFRYSGLEGVLELPCNISEVGGFSFANTKLTGVRWKSKPTYIGYAAFLGNDIVSIDNLSLEPKMDFIPLAYIGHLKNVTFLPEAKRIVNGSFWKNKLRSIEIPEGMCYLGTIGNLEHSTSEGTKSLFSMDKDPDSIFLYNYGWYPKNTTTDLSEIEQTQKARGGKFGIAMDNEKVALYRKNDGGAYVTDNSVEDGNTFVINPVLVEVKLVNQHGDAIDKELTLKGNIARKKGAEDTKLEDIRIEGKENWKKFKLGDSYTFAAPELEGLELREVDGKKIEGSVPSEITVEISTENGTKEEKYDDSYKVGYMKKVITLTYFDKNAKKDPVIPDPVIPDPIIPDPVIPDPVVPAPTPIVPNLPTPPVEVAEAEIIPEVVPEIPEVNPEEILSVEEAEIPESPAAILPTDEEAENLDILGDEIPQGKTEIKKDKEKKGKAKKAVSKNALAKTGGLQNIFFYVLSGLMVLLAAYGFIEVLRKRKVRD